MKIIQFLIDKNICVSMAEAKRTILNKMVKVNDAIVNLETEVNQDDEVRVQKKTFKV